MSRNALQLIATTAMLCMSTLAAFAQPAPTAAQKFSIRNAAGETVILTAPASGVTPYALTFPSAAPSVNGQVLAGTTSGILSWVTASGGTVTDFTAGNLSPLFTTNVATSTTTPALTFNLTNQNANTVFAGPAGGGPGAPLFRALTSSDITGAALTKTDDANVTLTLGGSPSTALLNAASLTLGWSGLLSIARGGTNSSAAPTNGGVAYGDGSAYQFSAAGSSGQILKSNGAAAPTWVSANSVVTGSALSKADDANVTLSLTGTPGTSLLQPVTITAGWNGTLSTARGGTGLSTIGTANQVLAVNGAGTALTYVTPNAGTVTSFSAGNLNPLFTTNVATPTTTPNLTFALNTQNAGKVFAGPVSGPDAAPTFRALTGSDITGAALTKTDDANVTLTLGGSPSTALLNAASLTLGWNGLLSIARGGTNSSAAPTNGGVAYGDGSAYQFSAAGSSGQVLKSNGAAAPTWVSANSVVTGSALSKTDDANVTLTLTGAPGSALLNATNIAAGWTGTLSTARGGTGLSTIGTAGQVLTVNAGGTALEYTNANSGTVTSFSAGNLNPLFTTSVATATTTPALSFSLTSQSANTVFAAPDGSSGAPTFRTLVAADIPDLGGNYIKNQTALQSSSNYHISGNGEIEGQLQLKGTGTGMTTLQAGAQGGTDINYTLPITAPASNGYILSSTTGGTMSWADPASLPSSGWQTTGNSGTTAGTNFLGTTDNVGLVIKTNNTERMRVDADGQVGFNRSTPDATIDLNGGMIWRPDTLNLTSGATFSGGANVRHDNVSIGDRTYHYIYDTATYYGNRITGFTDGYNGKLLRIFNSTHTTLTLLVDDANSSAANRIRNPIGDNGNVGIADSGFADLIYDGESQRWLIHSVTGPTSTAASGFTYFARKLTNQTLTDASHGTTMQSSGMTINIFPDIVHTLDGMLYFSCPNSNTDVKISFDLPDNFVIARITALGHSDGGTNVVEGSDILDTDNGASETFNVSANKILFIQISGMFINGPANGTLTVKFARANGGGGTQDLTLLAGSYLRLIPVGVN